MQALLCNVDHVVIGLWKMVFTCCHNVMNYHVAAPMTISYYLDIVRLFVQDNVMIFLNPFLTRQNISIG